ncbi:LysM peptidoglycan-binding domain-containing protein [Psychroserpens damuponensis]|uniref:LysM peptidoglycan-binding domain-containing protein n=1 Tax=Psychroserpens damuponensis TaxID=943936 RepID=UPI00058F477D|nr:LysM peptidoglycan-binding domain-containing protein [Psychroserpens damuponensis]
MQANYKFIITIILTAASTFGAVAQNKTHKDVVLDGKPAKLNVITGVVNLVELKTIQGEQVEVLSMPNSVINTNLITRSSTANKIDSTKATHTNRPDTLANYYKAKHTIVSTDELETSKNVVITPNSTATLESDKWPESKRLEVKETATSRVYEVENSTNYNGNTSDFHEVLKGETLYAISKRYHTTLGDLKKANNLQTTLIKTGQILRIKNFDSNYNVQTSNNWVVSKGDTLYNIAKRNHTTVAAIKSLNNLKSNLIIVGQTLQLK